MAESARSICRMTDQSNTEMPLGVVVKGEITPAFAEILTPEALDFVAKLQRAFGRGE